MGCSNTLEFGNGPITTFSGTSSEITARNHCVITVVEDSTFATLQFKTPAVDASGAPLGDAVDNQVTFPAGFQIVGVKSFELASGNIVVYFDK